MKHRNKEQEEKQRTMEQQEKHMQEERHVESRNKEQQEKHK